MPHINPFNDSTYKTVFAALILCSSTIAAVCSTTIIFLIYKMKLRNGHILLIETMSWFQLLYDLTLFLGTVHVGTDDTVYNIANVGQIISGVSASLVSNVVALVAYYVVRYICFIDIYKHYPLILACVLTPAFINAALYIMAWADPGSYAYLEDVANMDMYFYIRLASIAVNFGLAFLTFGQIRSISTKNGRARSPSTSAISVSEKAITALATRLVYYPIVQAVSRFGPSWYEVQYNFDFNPDHASRSQFIAQCFMAVLTPAASVGYLAIFLVMQPHTYACLKATLSCQRYEPPRVYVTDVTSDASGCSLNDMHATARDNSIAGLDEGGVYGIRETSIFDRASTSDFSMGEAADSDLILLAQRQTVVGAHTTGNGAKEVDNNVL